MGIGFGIVVLVVAAYANSFRVPLLLDDHPAIVDNLSIRDLSDLGSTLSPPPQSTTAGRPFLNLSFALNYALSGLTVSGYHAVNLLIHLLAGFALFGIVDRTCRLTSTSADLAARVARPREFAAAVAALWLLHPLSTSAVTYVSQRAESLMGFCYLTTLYCFVRALTPGSSRAWLWLSALACFLGTATKEVMATAPVLVLLFDRAYVSPTFAAALRQRPWYYAALLLSWLFLAWLMLNSQLEVRGVGFSHSVSWSHYLATEAVVICRYLSLTLWPHPLVFDYGPDYYSSNLLLILPCGLVLAAILVGLLRLWRHAPALAYPGLAFFLLLAPTSTVVPIAGQPMAESRLYLPTAAAIVGLALLLRRLRWFPKLAPVLAAIAFTGLCYARNEDYSTPLRLWADTIAKNPGSSRGRYNYSLALAEQPTRRVEAIAQAETALSIRPDLSADAHYHLGRLLSQEPFQAPRAIEHLSTAVRLDANHADAYLSLGNLLATVPGKLTDALQCYQRALQIRPQFAEAHNDLATELAKLPDRRHEAVRHFEKAIEIRPNLAATHFNYGVALLVWGQLEDGIRRLDHAVNLDGSLAEARKTALHATRNQRP